MSARQDERSLANRRRALPAGCSRNAQYKLATKLVFSKLKPGLGLGKARILVSGAAPIAPEVLQFLASLDLPVREVYGQSEDTGPTSFNLPGKTKFGTVGPKVPGVDVKIAPDGEILVKGPNVFLGYLKEPEATAEVLIDGWLHSGDLGEFDADGYLKITGRKKEILITAGGKNISPKNIEGAIKNHPLVGEAVVIGDRRKYLTALVALDPEATARFVAEHAVAGAPESSSVVRAEIQRAIDEVNATLARVETVKKFVLLGAPLSIDKGELTPTLKVKRRIVENELRRRDRGHVRRMTRVRAVRHVRLRPDALRTSTPRLLAARWCRERGVEGRRARVSSAAQGGAWRSLRRRDQGGRGEGGHPWKTFMRALLVGGAVEGDVDALVDFLWDAQPTRNLWRRPVPGMLELAKELVDAGVGVAIISNSEGHLAELLAEVGLAELFPIVLDSGKLGLEKPDPRIFERALAELGAKPHEAVHIGDSFAADVRGALGAGLAAVWFRGRAPATTELDRDRALRADDAASARAALRDLGVPI